MHIHARSLYLDTNWGDPDTANHFYGKKTNWETSNSLAKSNLLDYDKYRDNAQPQQVNLIRALIQVFRTRFSQEAIRNVFNYLPEGLIIVPANQFPDEFRYNRFSPSTTKVPWKRRKSKEKVGHGLPSPSA